MEFNSKGSLVMENRGEKKLKHEMEAEGMLGMSARGGWALDSPEP